MAEPRATVRSVAAHAGVSKSVVSRVLQGASNVSPQARAAVEAAIAELGYRPNATARSLTQRRTNAVGVIVNDLRQPWFAGMLEGLGAALAEHGLHVVVGDGRIDRTLDDRLVNALMDMRVDGLVLAGSMRPSPLITEAAALIPTVVAGGRDIDLPCVDTVSQDDALGMRLALDHLWRLGHRRIAHVAGDAGRVFELRSTAYADWMRAHSLTPAMAVGETTEGGGYAAAVRLLGSAHAPTAILAGNDVMALGVLAVARETGAAVPGDLSVVGFDDTFLAGMRYIDLTSVHASPLEIGSRTAARLVQRIEQPRAEANVELVVPSLTVRGTTSAVMP